MAGGVDEEVQGEEVVVTRRLGEPIGVGELLQAQDLLAQFVVAGHVDGAVLLEDPLVLDAFGDEVEVPGQRGAGFVQAPVHAHGLLELVGTGCVQVP